MKTVTAFLLLALLCQTAVSQQTPQTDSNTPLHLLRPDYPLPYGPTKPEDVAAVLNRVHGYLDQVTHVAFINSKTSVPLLDLTRIDENTILKPGDFRIVSYEWGVAYAGMLLASEATGDPRFRDYTEKRLQFIADAVPFFRKTSESGADWGTRLPLRNLLAPRALDDCGAMCAAMIKAHRGGSKADLRPLIDRHIDYIMNKEFRLKDGTLARNRPQPNTIWLDDLFMSIPALAQMGKLTGDARYYDEAAKQLAAYTRRMFNKEKGLFMHGWVEAMTEHPEFFWARANGWAFMTEVELLEVLPENHRDRPEILRLLRAHAKGLAAQQSGSGFWHQLLDRQDSYLETSATAIYTYALARAINRGWIDPLAYGPMTLLAWNAVSTKVNQRGQVEGTCVGTGMGFDPAFYYFRPTSPFAAHGYGPVLLAGAEVINLLKNRKFEINDSSVQMLETKPSSN
ncbi:MAG TPA: glycoside hydrolase family 88 protein [Pyrinomonadaceae bacterium]|nr:glycoside hydrolase family 88 protein [Pyrinomonadaceae bacterium]